LCREGVAATEEDDHSGRGIVRQGRAAQDQNHVTGKERLGRDQAGRGTLGGEGGIDQGRDAQERVQNAAKNAAKSAPKSAPKSAAVSKPAANKNAVKQPPKAAPARVQVAAKTKPNAKVKYAAAR